MTLNVKKKQNSDQKCDVYRVKTVSDKNVG